MKVVTLRDIPIVPAEGAAERIAGCGLNALIRESLPFIAINVAALILLATVPQISLFLPRLVGY